ncbi:MAG TPA: hypothetical protein VI790_01255 [Candidatus Nanoarchaeia archaeon]|nr:hypothetical protein [Candidatus Nanoarchaeia archaeon]
MNYKEFLTENKTGLIISLIKKEPQNNLLYQLLRIQDNKEKIITIEFYKTFNNQLKEIYNDTLDEMIFKEKRLFRKERILQL